jgi:hypothetical protein
MARQQSSAGILPVCLGRSVYFPGSQSKLAPEIQAGSLCYIPACLRLSAGLLPMASNRETT